MASLALVLLQTRSLRVCTCWHVLLLQAFSLLLHCCLHLHMSALQPTTEGDACFCFPVVQPHLPACTPAGAAGVAAFNAALLLVPAHGYPAAYGTLPQTLIINMLFQSRTCWHVFLQALWRVPNQHCNKLLQPSSCCSSYQ